jgi:tetratricopeptide (TPR) repeat protein
LKTYLFRFKLDPNPKKNGKNIYNLTLLLKTQNVPELRVFPIMGPEGKDSIEGIGISGPADSVQAVARKLRKYLKEKKTEFSEEVKADTDTVIMPALPELMGAAGAHLIEDLKGPGRSVPEEVSKTHREELPALEDREQERVRKALLSGIAFYRLGMMEDSRRQLMKAVEKTPDNAEAHHYLGLVFEAEGSLEEAEREFRRAIEIDEESGASYFFLANILQRQSRNEESVDFYKKAIEMDPEAPIIYNNLGWVFYQMGDFEKALRSFEEAVNLDPDLPFPHNGIGCIYQEMDYIDDAIEEFRKTIEIYPGYAAAHLKLGWCWFQKGNLDEAIDEFNQCIQTSSDDQYTLSAHYSLGHAYFAQERRDQALQEFLKAVEMDSEFVDALYFLGFTLVQLNMFDEAVEPLKRVYKLAPDFSPDLRKNLSLVMLKKGKYRESARYAKEALEQEPNDAESHDLLGNIYAMQDQWEKALKHYHTALELNPDSAPTHFNLGAAFERLGEEAKAEEKYKKAIQLDSEFVDAYSHLGWLYLDQGKSEEALVLFEKALELQPDDLALLENLGWTHNNLKNYSKALDLFRKVLNERPDATLMHNSIGIVLYNAGNLDEAEEEFKFIVEHEDHPDVLPIALHYLGLISLKKGRLDDACTFFNDSTQGALDYPEPHYYLGLCLAEQGKTKLARKAWRRYLDLVPEGEFAADARAGLAALPAK